MVEPLSTTSIVPNAEAFAEMSIVPNAELKANTDQNIEDNNSPLIVASQEGHVQIVTKLLLQENSDTNRRGYKGRTALWYACNHGKEGVVDALLKANADQNICDTDDNSPLIVASKEGHVHIVTKLLLQENTNVNKRGYNGRTALWHACDYGKEGIVDALLDANADQNICNNQSDSPLLMASKNGHVQIVTKLLRQENNNVNQRWQHGWTALYNACLNGHEDVVDALLDANADPNICTEIGTSPLMIASREGYSKIVQKLLQCNADISKQDEDSDGALSLAREYNRDEVVAILENFITEKGQSISQYEDSMAQSRILNWRAYI